MERRKVGSSEYSIPSTIREDAEVAVRFVGLEVQEKATPQQVLYRALSQRTVVSTTSTNAEKQQKASTFPDDQTFTKIGGGSCGDIFHQLGTSQVVKRAKADNEALWNDLVKHKLIIECFTEQSHLTTNLRVPDVYYYIENKTNEGKDWWEQHNRLFAKEDSLPADLLFSERIHPLPLSVREALVNQFFHSFSQEQRNNILKKEENKNCLIRLYCGKRRRSKFLNPDIRNYTLFLDQMIELDLDVNAYATTMADALAVLHWRAKVDARDVEFVLGSSPLQSHNKLPASEVLEKKEPGSRTSLSTTGFEFRKRKVDMWLLDFNQVKRMSMDEAGMRQAVMAFRENDPYYPRPSRNPQATNDPTEKATRSHDNKLWQTFSKRYVTTSRELLKDQKEAARVLPDVFIQQIWDSQMQYFATMDADTGSSHR